MVKAEPLQEWERHVHHTHADKAGTAWCGERLTQFDLAFACSAGLSGLRPPLSAHLHPPESSMMSITMNDALDRKARLRCALAALPVADKLVIVVRMQIRANEIRVAMGRPKKRRFEPEAVGLGSDEEIVKRAQQILEGLDTG